VAPATDIFILRKRGKERKGSRGRKRKGRKLEMTAKQLELAAIGGVGEAWGAVRGCQ